MAVIGIILMVLFTIGAFLLIFFVLIQDEQGEGIGGMFAGGSGSAFGSRSGNILTRITSILAVGFFVLSFGIAFVNRSGSSTDLIRASRLQRLEQEGDTLPEWLNLEDVNSGEN
ncbi:MAG: preprotein translocase subunit SecG [Spirochaetales bacterium]|jgi:preprotein translocase subunit SecG|nr:preprotein translocase subunit SecG [Spirochaetales bacterium]